MEVVQNDNTYKLMKRAPFYLELMKLSALQIQSNERETHSFHIICVLSAQKLSYTFVLDCARCLCCLVALILVSKTQLGVGG